MPHSRHWFAAILITLASLTSCVGTGSGGKLPTPQAIASMTDEEFALYLRRVDNIAGLTAWSAVKLGATAENVADFVESLREAHRLIEVLEQPPADLLAQAAARAGLPPQAVDIIVLEVAPQFAARGGLPGGERGKAILKAMISGVETGAAAALAMPSPAHEVTPLADIPLEFVDCSYQVGVGARQ
jgi:hypothetical protein